MISFRVFLVLFLALPASAAENRPASLRLDISGGGAWHGPVGTASAVNPTAALELSYDSNYTFGLVGDTCAAALQEVTGKYSAALVFLNYYPEKDSYAGMRFRGALGLADAQLGEANRKQVDALSETALLSAGYRERFGGGLNVAMDAGAQVFHLGKSAIGYNYYLVLPLLTVSVGYTF